MRNKPYVAAAGIPGLLLLCWAFSFWWNENGILALVVGALAAALLFAAYRIAQAASFAPGEKSKWDSTRSAGVNNWLDAQSAKDDPAAAKR